MIPDDHKTNVAEVLKSHKHLSSNPLISPEDLGFNINMECIQTQALCVCPVEDCFSPAEVWTMELWEMKARGGILC